MMDSLLSVFLYLGVVTSPNTYTDAQITSLEQIYQSQVTTIEANPGLMDAIIEEYYPLAQIIIIDDTVG